VSKKVTRRKLLKDFAPLFECPSVLEIGVWKGDFSEMLLDVLDPQRLVLVDPWQVCDEYTEAWYGPSLAPSEMEAIYFQVVSKFEHDPRVKIIRTKSTNLPLLYPCKEFDFIYIDGDHTENVFKADLEVAACLCKEGGYIVCDDYGLPGWWDDAITRTIDNLNDPKFVHLGARGTQYVLQRALFHNC
jgi:hypothetical protein